MSLQTLVYTGDDMEAAAAAIRDGLEPGDVVLIKGRGEQRLDRIVLLMEGRKVGCKLTACWLKNVRCESCSMLERGWDGLTPVT